MHFGQIPFLLIGPAVNKWAMSADAEGTWDGAHTQ